MTQINTLKKNLLFSHCQLKNVHCQNFVHSNQIGSFKVGIRFAIHISNKVVKMKTVKLIEYNGFYGAKNSYSKILFRQAGLKVYFHYLSLSALKSHFKNFNIAVKVV